MCRGVHVYDNWEMPFAFDSLSEGQRSLLAASMSFAHNHPFGCTTPLAVGILPQDNQTARSSGSQRTSTSSLDSSRSLLYSRKTQATLSGSMKYVGPDARSEFFNMVSDAAHHYDIQGDLDTVERAALPPEDSPREEYLLEILRKHQLPWVGPFLRKQDRPRALRLEGLGLGDEMGRTIAKSLHRLSDLEALNMR